MKVKLLAERGLRVLWGERERERESAPATLQAHADAHMHRRIYLGMSGVGAAVLGPAIHGFRQEREVAEAHDLACEVGAQIPDHTPLRSQ